MAFYSAFYVWYLQLAQLFYCTLSWYKRVLFIISDIAVFTVSLSHRNKIIFDWDSEALFFQTKMQAIQMHRNGYKKLQPLNAISLIGQNLGFCQKRGMKALVPLDATFNSQLCAYEKKKTVWQEKEKLRNYISIH